LCNLFEDGGDVTTNELNAAARVANSADEDLALGLKAYYADMRKWGDPINPKNVIPYDPSDDYQQAGIDQAILRSGG
jgi:hypothetical protein